MHQVKLECVQFYQVTCTITAESWIAGIEQFYQVQQRIIADSWIAEVEQSFMRLNEGSLRSRG